MEHEDTGATPFERLRSHMEHRSEDLVCPDCGYEDDGGEWTAETSGDRVLYRHVCPSCGSIRKRTFDLRGDGEPRTE